MFDSVRSGWSTHKKLMFLKAAAAVPAVEDTTTGNPLTFVTDLAKPLKSLLIPFTPVQSGTGDPSPDNIRPIMPWDGLNVEHYDENLLAINRTYAQSTQGMTYTPIKQNNVPVAVKVEGTRTNVNPFFNLNYITKVGGGAGIAIPPGTYKIFGGTAEVRFQVFYHDANGVERLAGYDDGSGETVTIPADCTASWCRLLTWVDTPVDTVIYPIILSADSSVTVYPVSFPSLVYGGTLDVVSGVLTVEWAEITLNGSEEWVSAENDTFFVVSVPAVKNSTAKQNLLCDLFKYSQSAPAYLVGGNFTNSITSTFNIRLKKADSEMTLTEFKNILSSNNMHIVYKLESPQTVQLTAEQITALIGQNTLWSDANGSMTAVYLKKK